MPEVSVIIPTYRHRDYILTTLDSVFAQSFRDFEVIVINDGSPDDTAAVLKPLIGSGRIRYIEQANAGQAAARNVGLRHARGQMIALLDDDDIWPEDKLEWQVDVLRQKPHVGAVLGDRIRWDGKTAAPRPQPAAGHRLLSFEELFSGNPIASPGQALVRSEVMARVGGFNPRIWGSDDYDLWFRICKVSQFEVYDRVALLYRVHETNASHNLDRMLVNCLGVLETQLMDLPPARRFERRRAANRWLYQYAGEQIVARLKTEIGNYQFRKAADSAWSLAAFSRNAFRDPTLLRQIGNDLFPLRQRLKESLPAGWVQSIRSLRGRKKSVVPPVPPAEPSGRFERFDKDVAKRHRVVMPRETE